MVQEAKHPAPTISTHVLDTGRGAPAVGIHVDSPVQRQWISFDSIGSIRRMASTVRGAAGSQ